MKGKAYDEVLFLELMIFAGNEVFVTISTGYWSVNRALVLHYITYIMRCSSEFQRQDAPFLPQCALILI